MSNESNKILDIDDLNSKMNKIINTMDKLDLNIEKINKKVIDINKIYLRFELNETLPLKKTNTYLKFQIDLLNTEKRYYKNIKKIILEKISSEIYEIAEFSLLMLSSLNDINLEKKIEKNNILNKIVKIKKKDKIDYNNIIVLINSTIKNLNLIDDFLKLIDDFIKEELENSSKKNYHTTNFKVSIQHKKNHIGLEYKKYCEQLNELIDYFMNCSKSILSQLEKQDLFKFFVNKND